MFVPPLDDDDDDDLPSDSEERAVLALAAAAAAVDDEAEAAAAAMPEEPDPRLERAGSVFADRAARCLASLQLFLPLDERRSVADAVPFRDPAEPVAYAAPPTADAEALLASPFAAAVHGITDAADLTAALAGAYLLAGSPDGREALAAAIGGAGPFPPDGPDPRLAAGIAGAVLPAALAAFHTEADRRAQGPATRGAGPGRSPHALADVVSRRLVATDPATGASRGWRPLQRVLLCASGLPCFDGETGAWCSALDVGVRDGLFSPGDAGEREAREVLDAAFALLADTGPRPAQPVLATAIDLVHWNARWMRLLHDTVGAIAVRYRVADLRADGGGWWPFLSGRAAFAAVSGAPEVRWVMAGHAVSLDYADGVDVQHWAFVERVLGPDDLDRDTAAQRALLGWEVRGTTRRPLTAAGVAVVAVPLVGLALLGAVIWRLHRAAQQDPSLGELQALLRFDGPADPVELARAAAEPGLPLFDTAEARLVGAAVGVGFLSAVLAGALDPAARGAWPGLLPLACAAAPVLAAHGVAAALALVGNSQHTRRALEAVARGLVFQGSAAFLLDSLERLARASIVAREPAADVVLTDLGPAPPPLACPALFRALPAAALEDPGDPGVTAVRLVVAAAARAHQAAHVARAFFGAPGDGE